MAMHYDAFFLLKTGPAKAGPAGPPATASTDIEYHVISFLIQSIHITSIVLLCIELIDGVIVSSLPTWAVL